MLQTKSISNDIVLYNTDFLPHDQCVTYLLHCVDISAVNYCIVLLLISLTNCNVDSASSVDFRFVLLLCFNHHRVIVDFLLLFLLQSQHFLLFSLLLFRLTCNYLLSASIFHSFSTLWILRFLLQPAPLAVLLLPTPMSCFPLLRQQCLFPSLTLSRLLIFKLTSNNYLFWRILMKPYLIG